MCETPRHSWRCCGSMRRWEALWSSDGLSLVRLLDADDVRAKMVYVLTNAVEAGLVSRRSEWPGLTSRPVDLAAEAVEVDRPKTRFFETSSLPMQVSLRYDLPPALAHLAEAEVVGDLQRSGPRTRKRSGPSWAPEQSSSSRAQRLRTPVNRGASAIQR